jgi:hypothetical protein
VSSLPYANPEPARGSYFEHHPLQNLFPNGLQSFHHPRDVLQSLFIENKKLRDIFEIFASFFADTMQDLSLMVTFFASCFALDADDFGVIIALFVTLYASSTRDLGPFMAAFATHFVKSQGDEDDFNQYFKILLAISPRDLVPFARESSKRSQIHRHALRKSLRGLRSRKHRRNLQNS